MVRRRLQRVPRPGRIARLVAPAAFLLAVTGVVLLVRSSLRSSEPATRTATTVSTKQTAGSPARPRPDAAKSYYLISSGDTLGAIADRFGTTVDDLLKLNPGIEPTALRPGEQIRVR
jgi:LysM repeat protein